MYPYKARCLVISRRTSPYYVFEARGLDLFVRVLTFLNRLARWRIRFDFVMYLLAEFMAALGSMTF